MFWGPGVLEVALSRVAASDGWEETVGASEVEVLDECGQHYDTVGEGRAGFEARLYT